MPDHVTRNDQAMSSLHTALGLCLIGEDMDEQTLTDRAPLFMAVRSELEKAIDLVADDSPEVAQ